MAGKKKADAFHRLRFAVPKEDESIIRWLNAQSNMSYSLRVLIKRAILKSGYTDITCELIERDRRGRPTQNTVDHMHEAESLLASEFEERMPGKPTAQIPSEPVKTSEVKAPVSQTREAPEDAPFDPMGGMMGSSHSRVEDFM